MAAALTAESIRSVMAGLPLRIPCPSALDQGFDPVQFLGREFRRGDVKQRGYRLAGRIVEKGLE